MCEPSSSSSCCPSTCWLAEHATPALCDYYTNRVLNIHSWHSALKVAVEHNDPAVIWDEYHFDDNDVAFFLDNSWSNALRLAVSCVANNVIKYLLTIITQHPLLAKRRATELLLVDPRMLVSTCDNYYNQDIYKKRAADVVQELLHFYSSYYPADDKYVHDEVARKVVRAVEVAVKCGLYDAVELLVRSPFCVKNWTVTPRLVCYALENSHITPHILQTLIDVAYEGQRDRAVVLPNVLCNISVKTNKDVLARLLYNELVTKRVNLTSHHPALYWACEENNMEVLQMLLNAIINHPHHPSVCSQHQLQQAWMLAFKYANLECLRTVATMLYPGVSVEDNLYRSVLQTVVGNNNNSAEEHRMAEGVYAAHVLSFVLVTLKEGQELELGVPRLHLESWARRYPNVVQFVVWHNTNIAERSWYVNLHDNDVWKAAGVCGDTYMLDELLEDLKASGAHKFARYALDKAVEYNHVRFVRKLLATRHELQWVLPYTLYSLLCCAVRNNSAAMLQVLLDYGYPFDAVDALADAVSNNRPQLLDLLLTAHTRRLRALAAVQEQQEEQERHERTNAEKDERLGCAVWQLLHCAAESEPTTNEMWQVVLKHVPVLMGEFPHQYGKLPKHIVEMTLNAHRIDVLCKVLMPCSLFANINMTELMTSGWRWPRSVDGMRMLLECGDPRIVINNDVLIEAVRNYASIETVALLLRDSRIDAWMGLDPRCFDRTSWGGMTMYYRRVVQLTLLTLNAQGVDVPEHLRERPWFWPAGGDPGWIFDSPL